MHNVQDKNINLIRLISIFVTKNTIIYYVNSHRNMKCKKFTCNEWFAVFFADKIIFWLCRTGNQKSHIQNNLTNSHMLNVSDCYVFRKNDCISVIEAGIRVEFLVFLFIEIPISRGEILREKYNIISIQINSFSKYKNNHTENTIYNKNCMHKTYHKRMMKTK